MPVSITIRSDHSLLKSSVAGLRERLRAASVRGLERAVRLVQADLQKVAFRGQRPAASGLFRPGAAGNALGRIGGFAAASITANTVRQGPVVIATVGSALPYVRFHERGGTIHGQPWLKIPTIYARGYTGPSFVQRTKRGSLFVFGVKGSGKRRSLVPLYLLKHSVTLRARRMFETTSDRLRPMIVGEISGAIAAVRIA